MQATAAALRRRGVAARMWRPWDDDLADCDCLHLFGSTPDHLNVIEAAHGRGVPVVLSPIAWYDLRSLWREPRSLARRLAGCGKFLLRAAAPPSPPGGGGSIRPSISCCPTHRPKRGSCRRISACRGNGLRSCPTGPICDSPRRCLTPLSSDSACASSSFTRAASSRGRTSSIFSCAMEGTNVPILVLGDAVPGHERYAARCRQVAGPRGTVPGPSGTRRSAVGQRLCRVPVPGARQLVRNAGPGGARGRTSGHAAGAHGAAARGSISAAMRSTCGPTTCAAFARPSCGPCGASAVRPWRITCGATIPGLPRHRPRWPRMSTR